ncbi:hypothetical protein ACF064_01510 [Streptomyces sp. NPDC015492]|uniref:hypothetical protein n=1 Tax=Streptomyces sp. NPDC015492 TaxID=3364958 RepID=UPI0036FDA5E0
MDPAVIAAIVTSPTALIAAAAAYAAGRRQASGAHRGPVDAVRRQHQRDAYAALLVAANNFIRTTGMAHCRLQASQEEPPTGQHDYLEVLGRRAYEARRLAARAGLEALDAPLAVVSLEGPKHVADCAQEVKKAAQQLSAAAHLAVAPHPLGGGLNNVQSTRTALKAAVDLFTVTARDHLNGADTR